MNERRTTGRAKGGGTAANPGAILLVFDASCVLCSRSASFLAARDGRARLAYVDAGSETGRAIQRGHGLAAADLDAVVLVEGGRTYRGSTAALRALSALDPPWSLARLLLLVPGWMREPPYRFVARNRHRLFGTRSCPEPHPRLRGRLLS